MTDAGLGIRLGDTVHRAAKRFFLGTHRTATPEETLERIRPYLRRCGITRLADVTGLDRIGIHTVLAHRPNSPSLSNSAGKGFSLTAATVSAAMEGIEVYHAEALALPPVECPWSALPPDGRRRLTAAMRTVESVLEGHGDGPRTAGSRSTACRAPGTAPSGPTCRNIGPGAGI